MLIKVVLGCGLATQRGHSLNVCKMVFQPGRFVCNFQKRKTNRPFFVFFFGGFSFFSPWVAGYPRGKKLHIDRLITPKRGSGDQI